MPDLALEIPSISSQIVDEVARRHRGEGGAQPSGITAQKWDGAMADQRLTVSFDYGSMDFEALFKLERQLTQVILAAGVGAFDGELIAGDGSDGVLYMYGPDADVLFSAIWTTLAESTAIRNVVATLRYGPPADDARHVVVAIQR